MDKAKKLLVKSTMIIPVAILYIMLFHRALNVYIKQMDFYISCSGYIFMTVLFMVVWFAYAPLSKSCRKGDVVEMMYNLIPAEFALMPMFWERHFVICILLFVLSIGVELKIGFYIFDQLYRGEAGLKMRKKCQKAFYRLSVVTVCVIYIIPSAMSAFVYDLRPREYFSLNNLMFYIDDSAPTSDVYEDNIELLRCFDEEKWESYSIEDKVTLIQELADFECAILHIPKTTVSAKKIDRYTLGMYDRKDNAIIVDVQRLNKAGAKVCVNTTAHEIYHVYQYYLCENFDWDNDMADTYFFDNIKTWKEELQDYKSAYFYSYDEYSEQTIEESAREYAEQETEKIMYYLSRNCDSKTIVK